MIARLQGTVTRLAPEEVIVDVGGVGYRVAVPLDVWDDLRDGQQATLHISPYLREDRFDLYGFLDNGSRLLFEQFIGMTGVGPKLGLELCAVPRTMMFTAIKTQDPGMLTTIKGIGKKTAEKLLVDLKALTEKQPEIFGTTTETANTSAADPDAIEALKTLGYDTPTILTVLKNLPPDLGTTEERVAEALRAL